MDLVIDHMETTCPIVYNSDGWPIGINCTPNAGYIVFTEATWNQLSGASIGRESIRRYSATVFTDDAIPFEFTIQDTEDLLVDSVFWDTDTYDNTLYASLNILNTSDINGSNLTEILNYLYYGEYKIWR